MKVNKIILILLICLMSCNKDTDLNTLNCNCGIIVDSKITFLTYNFSIENHCSGNIQTFSFNRDYWLNKFVGDSICVSNVEHW